MKYPRAPVSACEDDYHGVKVADPYRPLEELDAPETRRWIEEENALTASSLAEIPERQALRARLAALWNHERCSPPVREGGRYFFERNEGLENQPVLYVLDSLAGAPRPLLDVNALSPDGTVALAGWSPSRDGRLLAYGLARSGSDWNEWRVRDVASGRDLPDELRWVKFSGVSWSADNRGFYYSRYDAPAPGEELTSLLKNQKVRYHSIGTRQEEDPLIYARPDEPDWGFSAEVTDDGGYLVLSIWQGTDTRSRLYYRDLPGAGDFRRLLDDFDAKYAFVGNAGSRFYVLTDRDAPRGRIVMVDVAEIRERARDLRDVVPEGKDVIEGASLVARRLVVRTMRDAASAVALHALDGALEGEIALPALGTVSGFAGRIGDPETFYAFASFTHPTAIYRYDFGSNRSEVFRRPPFPFDPEEFETREVFYPSLDGTKIPMFLVLRKGSVPDGAAPTYLYGYGGFDIALTPAFSPRNLAFVMMGGIYAQACLRGGSEYGEEWHRAGMLEKKQNVFDDFAAAARWLVAQGYTNPSRLAIGGGSNGGLLVGAVLNQHPELFGAAVPAVGVMDMLRFQKFTIGWAWASDYGSSDDPEQFRWLLAYSPYHNIREGAAYPPVLVVTADHDDRVFPGHSFKYAARLQAAQAGEAPILIRVETRAGHGFGKPVAKQLDEAADVLGFLARSLGGLSVPP